MPHRRRARLPPGEQVRRAREKAGLSGRALAAAAGLPQATVSGVERGRDPALGTLAALARALPTLRPEHLLTTRPSGTEPLTERTWLYLHDALGLIARSVRLESVVTDEGVTTRLEVSGVRSIRSQTTDPDTCTALMGLVLVGSARATFEARVSSADLERGELVVQDGDVAHRFRFPRTLASRGFSYVREDSGPAHPLTIDPLGQLPHDRPFGRGVSLWLDYPAERLVLRVRFVGEAPPHLRVHAWPASAAVDAERSVECWGRLRPAAPRWVAPDGRGVAELRIERPLPGACHALSWPSDVTPAVVAPSPATAELPRPRPASIALVEARERSGLGVRELARRLGRSPASISELESGAEPRAATLARYLDVLPDLSPHDLLGLPEPDGPCAADETWRFQRALFGMEAALEERDCRILRDGAMRGVFRTRSLTWTREAASDLRLRHGLARVPEGSVWELDEVTTGQEDDEGVRIRVLRRGTGPVLHELKLHGGRRARSASFVRKVRVSGQFALTKARSRRPPFGGERSWEALYAEPGLPTRRLRFAVSFPKGYAPLRAEALVIPRGMRTTARVEDLGPRIHGGSLRFEDESARDGVLRVDVERPLVGLRYLLRWYLP